MHKKLCKIKETPFGYPFMHKKPCENEETPFGYPFMHKKLCKIKERCICNGTSEDNGSG